MGSACTTTLFLLQQAGGATGLASSSMLTVLSSEIQLTYSIASIMKLIIIIKQNQMIHSKSKRIDKNSPKSSKSKSKHKKKSSKHKSPRKDKSEKSKRKHDQYTEAEAQWDDSMFYIGKEMNSHFQKIESEIKNGYRFNRIRNDLSLLETMAHDSQNFSGDSATEPPAYLKSDAFSKLADQFALFFSHQQSKLCELKKAFKDNLHKNELNFCSKGIYEIYDNLSQLSNDEKLQICFELRDYENSNNGRSIIHEESQPRHRTNSGSRQYSDCQNQISSNTGQGRAGGNQNSHNNQRSQISQSNKGDTSFVIKFELLTTDEIHHIWEITDQFVQRNNRRNFQKEQTEDKIQELKSYIE